MKDMGDRFKAYEKAAGVQLMPRTPVIVRVDGKAFHTLTKTWDKPFDNILVSCMDLSTRRLVLESMGACLAYTQSDEISILLRDDATFDTQQWFGGETLKISTISASIVTAEFNAQLTAYRRGLPDREFTRYTRTALFDARAFNVPLEDVANYFSWRMRDWLRNSLHMVARVHFSQKQLHNKRASEVHEMLYSVGVNWADLSSRLKNGAMFDRHGRDITPTSAAYEVIDALIRPERYEQNHD